MKYPHFSLLLFVALMVLFLVVPTVAQTHGSPTYIPAVQPPVIASQPVGNVPVMPGQAPIVPQGDGTAERPMPAPFVLSAEEQSRTNAVLARWEGFSMSIQTFETGFNRILYRTSLDSAQLQKTQEFGELRYESPDHGMFAVNSVKGEPIEKWICDGESVFEYKFAQKQIDQYTLPPEMRGKSITQGPLPFLFGASADELKRRYYIRQIQPSAELVRPGQVWLEAFPKTSDDASEFQRAEMIISFGSNVRPLAIKLYKANRDQHVYIFDQKSMKVNKTKLLPSMWAPSMTEKVRMKIVPVE